MQSSLYLNDFAALFLKYLSLSLMSIGGAISVIPEMHRFLVSQHQWLTDAQFSSAIAIAQAAPGPNILFVALLGWLVGLNHGGVGVAVLTAFLTMSGILLPSAILTYSAVSWLHSNERNRHVIAFKQGLMPVVIALLLTSSWVLLYSGSIENINHYVKPLIAAITALLIATNSPVHILWILAFGAIIGAHMF